MGISKIQRGDGTAIFDISGDTVTAETLAQGATAHGANGTQITGTATAGVTPPETISAGDQIVAINPKMGIRGSTSMWATGCSITISKAGEYRFNWLLCDGLQGRTFRSQLYKNGTAISGAMISISGATQSIGTAVVACNAGDKIEVYTTGRTISNVFYGCAGNLAACINWDIGL